MQEYEEGYKVKLLAAQAMPNHKRKKIGLVQEFGSEKTYMGS